MQYIRDKNKKIMSNPFTSASSTSSSSWRHRAQNSQTSNSQTSNLLQRNSRFDSLKNNDDDGYQTERHQKRCVPQQESSSKLFSVNNASLADFIPNVPQKQQKYVSPAMRRRDQTQKPLKTNQFTQSRKFKKPILDLSGAAFPSMSVSGASAATTHPANPTTNYKAAVAMNDDDYETKQAPYDDETVYVNTDVLGNTHPAVDINCPGFKDPVCPYAAGKAAMCMIREYQYKRDEQNELLGAQSPYWNMKNLLDFTTDDEDSNYDSSSSDSENGVNDDDYY